VRIGEMVAADISAVSWGPGGAPLSSPCLPSSSACRPQTPHDLSRLPGLRPRYDGGREYCRKFERDGVELEIAIDGHSPADRKICRCKRHSTTSAPVVLLDVT
jgi:hypothetical protein